MANSGLPEKIQIMQENGKILADILANLVDFTREGRGTYEIDQKGKRLIEKNDAKSLSYGYGQAFGKPPYPGYIGVNINNEVTHGYGEKDEFIKKGDLVSIDVAIKRKGYCVDAARSFVVGNPTPGQQRLMDTTEEAMSAGISAAKTGASIGDIGHAIQSVAEVAGFSVVRELVGHSIGKEMHEDPMVPGWGSPNTGPILEEFQTIAMDTMINEGKAGVIFEDEGWIVKTADGKPSCLFEDTFYVDDEGGVVLTTF